jgi:nucleotide-binding universal stress UspA family protein
MSEHILVPLDGSSNAENAVPYAGKLAKSFDATLRFVRVAVDGEVVGDTSESSRLFADHVAELKERFGLTDLPSTTLFLRGNPAGRVLEEAGTASFVVLASHGRGGFRATFIGSVADKIVRGATKPVLVVPGVGRPAEPEFAPALVALDGSEEAELALTMARRITQAAGDGLILVRAYSLMPLTGTGFGFYPVDLPAALEQGATEYLDGVAGEADEKIIVQSDAAEAIRRAAEQYDAKLVVMTARGKGLAGRLALGSTTDRVLHSLHRPLLIIPAGQAG